MSNNDALVLIFSRNAFYKHLHFLVLGVLALTWVVIIGLTFMLAFIWKNPPKPLYFATDDVGRLIQNVPINTPNMSPEEVEAWVKDAVIAATSYDYINYRSQLQNAQKYFTSYGWSNYMKALTLSGNLRALTARKQIVIGNVSWGMNLLAQGILGGSYAWKFQMPVLITYQTPPYDKSSNAEFSNSLNVTVVVRRLSELEGYKGMAVVQFVAEAATEETVQQTKSISGQPSG